MHLADIRKSITELPPNEQFALIRDLRYERRNWKPKVRIKPKPFSLEEVQRKIAAANLSSRELIKLYERLK